MAFDETIAREGHQFGWSCWKNSHGELHVVPENDIKPHSVALSTVPSLKCICNPWPEPGRPDIIVHNSFDQREKLDGDRDAPAHVA